MSNLPPQTPASDFGVLQEALDVLSEVVADYCDVGLGNISSYGFSARADALRLLARHGRCVLVTDHHHMVTARWVQR